MLPEAIPARDLTNTSLREIGAFVGLSISNATDWPAVVPESDICPEAFVVM